jgi:4-amino-4-deoxy-L-arabinose transferase-like glycosyltransferase
MHDQTNANASGPEAVRGALKAGPGWRPVLLIALLAAFFFILLLVIPDPSKFHSDERYYTDAALQMLQTGDYWTPYYPDGQARLNKPILTYWAAAGSLRVFGVSLFAARLPFLLAGVLVVWLTFHLAQTVLKCGRTALLAALILASNIELMTLSTRATPDALVCLFVLVSMWGFARIWFAGDQSFVGPLLVFGGMGLAVQTKGLLGLCPLGANLLFCLLARPGRAKLKFFLNWPAIVVGIGLGVFWYALMLQRHGLGALHDFYDDQVGAQMTRNPGVMFTNLVVYLFAGFRHFMPWTLLPLLALFWFRRELAYFWKTRRRECLFLFSLFAVLVMFFSLGNIRRPRYLTASYPMLAVLLAAFVSDIASHAGLQRWLSRIIRIVAVIVLLGVAGLLVAGLDGDWRLAVGGGVLVACGLAGLMTAGSSNEAARWTWVAGMGVIAFGIVGACIRPVFSPSPLTQATVTLRQTNPLHGKIFTWFAGDNTASQLRLLSGGELIVIPLVETAGVPDLTSVGTVVTTSPHQEVFERAGYHLSRVTNTNAAIATSWLGRLMLEEAANAHNHPRQTFWIAVKSP